MSKNGHEICLVSDEDIAEVDVRKIQDGDSDVRRERGEMGGRINKDRTVRA